MLFAERFAEVDEVGEVEPDRVTAEEARRAGIEIDVRKLEALGLTRSLPVGYELSPRGRAVLGSRDGHRGR